MFVARRMTRPRSVKHTSAPVLTFLDLAPVCVTRTAGKGHPDETKPEWRARDVRHDPVSQRAPRVDDGN
jgi:hypothetical protein